MNNEMNAAKEKVSSVYINGMVVHLIFASEGNAEAIAVVKDILKGAYLRNHSVQQGGG